MSVENIGKAGHCRTTALLGSFVVGEVLLYKKVSYEH
jgi:hypothetical protein